MGVEKTCNLSENDIFSWKKGKGQNKVKNTNVFVL